MNSKKGSKKHRKSLKRFLLRLLFKVLSFRIFSDIFAIKVNYFVKFKKRINLKDPRTFNEKLNWIKLYYRKPIMTKMADKAEVKNIIGESIGNEYVIPTIAIFDCWNEEEFKKIPLPFVMKTTHSSGVIKIVNSYNEIDENLKKKFLKSLSHNYFYSCREWPYKNIKPRILIEKLIKDEKEENLPVFKFFCFNGKPRIVQTIKNDKTSYETIDYFDMNWKFLDLRQNFENSEKPLEKPVNFEEMKEIATKLSKGFPFVRVDLYSVQNKILFSEFTFFSDAGFTKFRPSEWDSVLGDMIKLDLNEKYC